MGNLETLNLSGGEPFIRPEVAEICSLFIENNGVKQIYVPFSLSRMAGFDTTSNWPSVIDLHDSPWYLSCFIKFTPPAANAESGTSRDCDLSIRRRAAGETYTLLGGKYGAERP